MSLLGLGHRATHSQQAKTPTKTKPISVATDTPANRGTSSMFQPADPKDHTRELYYMYLEQDWERRAHIEVSDFCAHILHTSTTEQPAHFSLSDADARLSDQYSGFDEYAPRADRQAADAIIASKQYQKKKRAYIDAKGEKNRYEPFVNLVNYVIDKLTARINRSLGGTKKNTGSNKLVLVRNDPKAIKGSIVRRSPDVVAIRERIKYSRGKAHDRSENWKTRNMNPYGFYWPELLFFVEFEAESSQTKATKTGSNLNSEPQRASSKIPSTVQASGTNASRRSSSKKRRAEGEADPIRASSNKRSKLGSEARRNGDEPANYEEVHPDADVEEPEYTKQGKGYHIKCAGYALEMFANGGLRTFVLGLLVKGNSLQICSYQRSKIIVTKEFNFLEDDHTFIAVIEGLVKCQDDKQLGINKMFAPSKVNYPQMSRSTDSLVGVVFPVRPKIDNQPRQVNIKFTELLYIQRALICRGSLVVRGEIGANKCPEPWLQLLGEEKRQGKVKVVLKASSMAKTRTPEYDFITEATEKANVAGRRWALERLPTVLHWETSEDMDEHELRSAFALAGATPSYEIRELRILVLAPLIPVTEVTSGYELLRIYMDYIQVHKFLVQTVGTLHRDISLNNLMVRVKIVNGKVRKYGVVNDYDLAVKTKRKDTMHQQRTGTQPFMALELLYPFDKRHYARHDLESFFYAMLIHVSHWHEGQLVENPPYRAWEEGTLESVRKEKATFWFSGTITTPTLHFRNFKTILDQLFVFFKGGLDTLNTHIQSRRRKQDNPWLKKFASGLQAAISNGDIFDEELDDGELTSFLGIEEPEEPKLSFNLKTLNGTITHDKMLRLMKLALLTWSGDDKVVIKDPEPVDLKGGCNFEEVDEDNDELLERYIADYK